MLEAPGYRVERPPGQGLLTWAFAKSLAAFTPMLR